MKYRINYKEDFLNYLTKVRKRTNALVDIIPEEKVDWKYKKGKFSIGDILIHIALVERYMYAETFCNRKSLYTGLHRYPSKDLKEIKNLMSKLHQESIHIFSSYSEPEFLEKCQTPSGTPITRWKWLRALSEHEIHHRGQLYIYLNLMNINTPPMFGLSNEELIKLGGENA